MNAFDIGLLVVACILVLVGVVKGLVRILIGVAALVAAFALAAQYHRPLGEWLGWSSVPDDAMMLLSYILIFLGVMLAGGLVAFLLRKLLKAAMLGWADRMAGAALGLVAATLAAALLVLPMIAYSPGGSAMLRESVLAPYVVVVADIAAPLVPDDLERLYHERMQELRQFWQERMFEQMDPSEV
jgi:membrane protein required for colicin V production